MRKIAIIGIIALLVCITPASANLVINGMVYGGGSSLWTENTNVGTTWLTNTSMNVGIGTTTPSAKLDINGSLGGYAYFFKNGNEEYEHVKIKTKDVFNQYGGDLNFNFNPEEGFLVYYSGGTAAIVLSSQYFHINVNGITHAFYINEAGNVGIGIQSEPTAKLDINSDTIRLRTPKTPASNGTGNTGDIAWDADYFYICTAPNTWKRAALTGGY